MLHTRSLRRARPSTGFRPSRFAAIVTALALIFGASVAGAGTATAAAPANAVLSIDKSTITKEISAGSTLVWEMKIGCESLETICIDAVLHDSIPSEFTVRDVDVRVIGAVQNPTVTVGPYNATTGTAVDVAFNETNSRFPGIKGIEDGQKISVLVTALLPEDTPLTKDGAIVTNWGEVGGSNAATVKDESSVTLKVPPRTAVDAKKTWANNNASQLADPTATNSITIDIQNKSNIPASTLTIVEPSGATKPFTHVAVTGFDNSKFAMPQGAATVQVSATTASGTTTGLAGTTPSLPSGVDPAEVTGLTIVFASASGYQIVPDASGKVVLTTIQRAGVSTSTTTVVDNQVAATVVTAQNPATTEPSASFSILPWATTVLAEKSFSDTSLLIGEKSITTLTATNKSNTTLSSLTITEPAPGTTPNPFASILGFEGFGTTGDGTMTATAWPEGATAATVEFSYSDAPNSSSSLSAGDLSWPKPATGKHVTGFVIVYSGAIKVDKAAIVPFVVTGAAAGTVTNQVQVDGVGPAGAAAPSTATAAITVSAPLIVSTTTKSFVSGPNVADTQVVAKITGKVSNTSNSPVRKIIIEDSSAYSAANVGSGTTNFWDAFTASRVSGFSVPNNVTLTVQSSTDGVTYTNLAVDLAATTAVDIALPAGTKGVTFIYTATGTNSFANDSSVSPRIVFTLPATTTLVKPTNCANTTLKGDNGLTSPVSKSCAPLAFTGGTSPTTAFAQSTSKSWAPSTVLIPNDPNGTYPTQSLTITSKNGDNSVTASKLTLEDATSGTKPFDHFTITKINSITSLAGADANLTHIRLVKQDGSVIDILGPQGGTSAIDRAKALTATQLQDVTGITITVEGAFAPGAELKAQLTTVLRKQTRSTAQPITTAITVDNTVTGSASAVGQTTIENPRTASVKVVPAAQGPLDATLSKSFSKASTTVYSATEDKVAVTLGVTRASATPTATPTVYVVEDIAPTFWNAFDFAGLTNIAATVATPANYTVKVQFLTGRTFATVGGALVTGSGTWLPATSVESPLSAPNLALPTGVSADQVSGIRITYTAKTGNWGASAPTAKFDVTPRHYLRSGEATSDSGSLAPNPSETKNGEVTNVVTGTVDDGLRSGVAVDLTPVTKTFQFTAGIPAISIEKTPNTSAVVPGEEVPFKLTVKNDGTTPIVNPVFTDVIPWDAKGALLQYDPVTYTAASYSVIPATTSITTDPKKVTVTTTDFPKVKTEITFAFPAGSAILPGQTYTITVPMKVRAGVERNTTFVNTFRLVRDGGSSLEDTAEVVVLEGGSYGRIKDVQENLAKGESPTGLFHTIDKSNSCITDGGFYRVPCLVETKPGGTETWRLRVINTGNLPTTSMTMVDVFPKPGDTGTSKALSSLSRGSLWTPIFTGGIEYGSLPAGTTTTLWYQTAADKTCVLNGVPDSADPFGTTCADGQWHLSSTTDLSELKDKSVVTAIKLKFDFDKADWLKPGEQVEVTYQTKTPDELPKGVPAYTTDGAPTPAWNSFVVFTTTDKTSGPDYETLEPNKAGIAFATPVAVGDYVWVDADRDGVQDASELPLEGVKVTLFDAKDVEVATTTTDADGRYLFDELWPGDYHAEFELTTAQQAKYRFTGEGKGGDRALDSNANSVGVTAVFHLDAADAAYPEIVSRDDYASDTGISIKALYIDPTIDAGVIPSAVSVGDYVWLDENEDGIQDSTEAGIEGVVLTLIGPDGKAVTSVYGTTVGSTTTDVDGWYEFADLPILEKNEAYTVRIDYLASAIPLFGLFQSPVGKGTDATDSSRDFAVSSDLVADGDRDETLDFGFYAADFTTLPLPEPGDLPTLALTGGAIGGGMLLFGGLLTAGLMLVLLGRKPRGRHS